MDCIHKKLQYINTPIRIRLKYPPSITTSFLLYLMPCTWAAYTRWTYKETKRNQQYHMYYSVLRNIQSETKQLINSLVKRQTCIVDIA
jgi:hypothetical protein